MFNQQRSLELDKIIAVESLLNQMQILEDFGFDKVAIVEYQNSTQVSIKNNFKNMFGFEDSGIVTLCNAPGIVQSSFRVNDLRGITNLWKASGLYNIEIAFDWGNIKLLYKLVADTVTFLPESEYELVM